LRRNQAHAGEIEEGHLALGRRLVEPLHHRFQIARADRGQAGARAPAVRAPLGRVAGPSGEDVGQQGRGITPVDLDRWLDDHRAGPSSR
jgi:hypothetical protein